MTTSQQPYHFVFVNADGTARELHADERAYLETDFRGDDGGRPYIKSNYRSLNGWGEIRGYLARTQLPQGMAVAPAPAEDPNKPVPRDQWIAAQRRAAGLDPPQ